MISACVLRGYDFARLDCRGARLSRRRDTFAAYFRGRRLTYPAAGDSCGVRTDGVDYAVRTTYAGAGYFRELARRAVRYFRGGGLTRRDYYPGGVGTR